MTARIDAGSKMLTRNLVLAQEVAALPALHGQNALDEVIAAFGGQTRGEQ